ncbi:hypothetical protein RYZ26_00345 [Terasakiella sp. A23]|uniref:hypothetical protein n=1 Tax=Terasakiella sp. FCG-A23 TaxID=3080561 RepID=UPI0029541356|nr:hypothetical protein [Terasakiella sp. A23]MDV7338022.1 hypothetical protein [Terasakiella sp. A23]
MNDDLITAVQACVDKGVPARSVPFDWNGARYWIKISLASQKNIWHRLQDLVAFVTRAQIVRSTISASGQTGLDEEVARLKRVAERGVCVPQVIARKPGWVLLSDIGPCLFDAVNAADEKAPLLIQAIESLADLHQKGGWHGTGQLRDMITCPDGRIGFIDFEEGVGEVMAHEAAQARDVLRFLISIVRFDDGTGSLLEQVLAAYRAKAPKDVWPHVKSGMRLIAPLAVLLSPFEEKLGRDLREALLVYNAVKQIVRQP